MKGEDKIIIATHSFHSNTFHYHPELVTNSSTPLIIAFNLCPTPLLSTDCSVINIRGEKTCRCISAFDLVLGTKQTEMNNPDRQMCSVQGQGKGQCGCTSLLGDRGAFTNKTLVQFFQGGSFGTTRFLVSNSYLKCSI